VVASYIGQPSYAADRLDACTVLALKLICSISVASRMLLMLIAGYTGIVAL
jgi:hypothetical protein